MRPEHDRAPPLRSFRHRNYVTFGTICVDPDDDDGHFFVLGGAYQPFDWRNNFRWKKKKTDTVAAHNSIGNKVRQPIAKAGLGWRTELTFPFSPLLPHPFHLSSPSVKALPPTLHSLSFSISVVLISNWEFAVPLLTATRKRLETPWYCTEVMKNASQLKKWKKPRLIKHRIIGWQKQNIRKVDETIKIIISIVYPSAHVVMPPFELSNSRRMGRHPTRIIKLINRKVSTWGLHIYNTLGEWCSPYFLNGNVSTLILMSRH